jgi:hypothetical protein
MADYKTELYFIG